MKSHISDRIKLSPGFWEGLRPLGITDHEVARQARLPLTVITDPVVTTAQYFAIWQAYSDLMGDISKGIIKLATSYETAKFPPTVLATYHARDYRDALNRMARYKQFCPPEGLYITEEDESCTIELKWRNTEQPGPPILVGLTLAFLLELGRRGTGQPLTARYVEFSQSMGDMQALEAYFGCPVRMDAACNRLKLDRRDLDRYFVSYNEELLEILTPVLDQSLNEQKHSRSIAEMVKWMMKRSLTGGRLDIQAVAKEMGMSDRTLQRRLTGENTSFKHLLTQAGYEDQNSFYRAFRLWEGDTPSNWRKEHSVQTRYPSQPNDF